MLSSRLSYISFEIEFTIIVFLGGDLFLLVLSHFYTETFTERVHLLVLFFHLAKGKIGPVTL